MRRAGGHELVMAHGVGWRGVFLAAAASLAVLLIANALLLRETPGERGLPPRKPIR